MISGQRLRGLLAFAPIAVALYVAFTDLNGVYLAFLNENDAAAALEQALPMVWLSAGAAGLYGLLWGLVDLWWEPPIAAVRIVGGAALVGFMFVVIFGAVQVNERYGDPVALAQQKWEAFKTNDTSGRGQSRYLSASGSGRLELWRVAREDFAAHPVAGVGTQNYEATYYRLREDPGVQFVRQPHSLPLEVLAERGVVGGVLFFGFLAVCLAGGLWRRFGRLRSEGKAQIGALVAALTYWFAHSSAEWFWQIPAVTLPAFVYLAMLVSPWKSSSPTPLRWPLRVAGILVAVIAVAVITPLFVADRYLVQSRSIAEPKQALSAVEQAGTFNPLDPGIARREAVLASKAGNPGRAEDSYKLAIRLNPKHWGPYADLAAFYERREEPDKALLYYRKARALNPLDPQLEKQARQKAHAGTAADDGK